MSAILREGLKYGEQEKQTQVSMIPSYWVILLNLMMEWKLLDQRVDRAQQSTFYSAQNRNKKKKKLRRRPHRF